MEDQNSIFALLLSFIFIVGAIALWKRSTNSRRCAKLPPGPRKLPLIGNLHQLSGSTPHRRLRELAGKYGPIMHVQLGEVPAVIISSPEAAREVMKTHDLVFATRPEILISKIVGYDSSHIAFCPYGDLWRQLRKICVLELLSARRVQSFESIRAGEAEALFSRISSSSAAAGQTTPVNLSQMIYSFTNNVTALATFGEKSKHQERFMNAMKKITELAGGFDLPDIFPSLTFLHSFGGAKSEIIKVHRQVDGLLDDIIDEHRARRKNDETVASKAMEDLVDVLLRVQQSSDLEVPITLNTIKAVILVCILLDLTNYSTQLPHEYKY